MKPKRLTLRKALERIAMRIGVLRGHTYSDVGSAIRDMESTLDAIERTAADALRPQQEG